MGFCACLTITAEDETEGWDACLYTILKLKLKKGAHSEESLQPWEEEVSKRHPWDLCYQ